MRNLVRRSGSTVLLLWLVPLSLGAQPRRPGAPAVAVQYGVSVTPDTVAVGDPFVVRLRVRAPKGSVVLFPDVQDTSSAVQSIDPRAVRDSTAGDAVESSALYRVAAWDVGPQGLGLSDIIVRTADGEQRISLGSERVVVMSVLPADSTLRVPKPARPVFEVPRSLWWLWLITVVAAAIVGLLIWWWKRRGSNRPVPVVDPLALAESEFARVEGLGLVEAGERGRYVALMVEVLRDYLARRVGTTQSLTSTELIHALRKTGMAPIDRLTPLLTETDLVKFARYQVGADRARHLANETREIVRQVQVATEPKTEADATAARAAA